MIRSASFSRDGSSSTTTNWPSPVVLFVSKGQFLLCHVMHSAAGLVGQARWWGKMEGGFAMRGRACDKKKANEQHTKSLNYFRDAIKMGLWN